MDGSAHEGGPVVPAERLVHRERLLRDLRTQGEEAGITVIVAPDGFGKTTLLVQRVAEVRSRIERGSARMLDLEGFDEVQAYESIKRLSEDLDPRMRPLIALDNLTTLQRTRHRGDGRSAALHEGRRLRNSGDLPTEQQGICGGHGGFVQDYGPVAVGETP